MRILIVEDERYSREALVKMIHLYDSHFVVREAENGDRAKARIEKEPFDLVITDIRMPACDGLELARWIRDMYPETEIAILSGYEQFDYAVEAVRLGVREYLLKPIDENQLRLLLDKVGKARRTTGDKIVDTVDAYIRSRRGGNVNIAEMCKQVLFLDPAYVSRHYHSVTGHTISWAVQDARLSKARALLADTGRDIAEIAMECGYQSISSFNQSFAKKYGASPSAYRAAAHMETMGEGEEQSPLDVSQPVPYRADEPLQDSFVKVTRQMTIDIKTAAGTLGWQISSVDDVDTYLAEMRSNLLRLLEEGMVINIVF